MQRALVSFCLWYMKTLSICATILLTTLMACDKPVVEKGEGDLLYANVQTPKIASVNQGIVSQLRVTGPNLCYSLSYINIFMASTNEIYINARGKVPTGSDICAQAIYTKDTTVKIAVPNPGKYILKFYTRDHLFQSDTVQVN